ncbi:ArsR family transcriptional regulator [Stigmatella aurantiaca]|uniref:O-demethylpuromycin-O-methyltransferase n=1 Tax=Stigmatella aurantiaca (strain DW4/3-1) TaxID=378806 RepID=Q097H2_STIAD|nr:ArsR family transcriptional regulator [Stigmatella aurantiaca]ADO69873.1 O-demethylpuromycin-O-methyltransferase [Stigmatella aurantiaca DW4/3-1]EAU67859.1 O-demethylpuromycin-O-methyltransferase [Stigmatella aurantiaca DW4/3-1]
MNPSPPHPAQLIVDLGFGYILSGALAAAAELGVADHLAQGPKSPADLAKALGADASSLFRVLRLLASAGVFTEDTEGRFGLTPAADLLRSQVPGSLRDAVLMLTQKLFWAPTGELAETVRTGQTPFDRIFGKPFFDHLASDTAAGTTFHRGMSSLSDLENGSIARSYDFSPFQRVVDVGGGHGGFLIEVLQSSPKLRGVLFDHAHVLEGSRIASAGLADRCEHTVGDFFQTVPAGADVYVLKRILHDWSDEVCVNILRNCRNGMREGGRVLVIDAIIPPGNAPHGGKVLDVMMLAVLPGRERTEAEFQKLFAQAGLRLSRIIPTPTALSITEAVAT